MPAAAAGGRALVAVAAVLCGAACAEALEIAAYPKPLQALAAMVAGDAAAVTLLQLDAPGAAAPPDIVFLAGPEVRARAAAQALAPAGGIVDFAPEATWLDPDFAALIVLDIADRLALLDPDNASLYRDNAGWAAERLDGLRAEIAELLAPLRGRPFLTFGLEDGSFEHRFALVSAGHLVLAPEHRRHLGGVAPEHLAPLRAAIGDAGARCVIGKGPADLPLLQLVVHETPARAVWIDIEGRALPPGPALYFETLRRVAQAYRDCLARE
jgi:zinc transport system substrate-binding protein